KMIRGPFDKIISFSPFIDDTAVWADLILPASHYLETEVALIPQVTPKAAVSVAAPFVRTLHDTRPFEQILSQLADYAPVTAKDLVSDWDTAQRNGGEWKDAPPAKPSTVAGSFEVRSAEFSGDAAQYPLTFQPYVSLQFGEGSGGNLPWMQ